MYLESAIGVLLCALRVAAAQSYSFGIAVDNPDYSPAFTFQPVLQSDVTPRGAARTASGRVVDTSVQRGDRHTISSFVFSGLEDPVEATPRKQPQPRQRQPQSQPQQIFQHRQPPQTPVHQPQPRQRQPQQFQRQPQKQQQQRQLTRQQPSRNVQRQWEDPANEENEITPLTIGKSPCARGIVGHECRMHLKSTALACTSGKCYQCQKCGSIPAKDWIACCRDHFLCCRPLARSCQRCDQPSITPFCNIAFKKCY